MEEYKVSYVVEKKGRNYRWTRSCDRTLPGFLQGGNALLRGDEVTEIEDVLLERAKEMRRPLKLDVIFRLEE